MWITLALTASFLYSLTNIIDKVLVGQYKSSGRENGMELTIVTGLAIVIPLACLLVVQGMPLFSPSAIWGLLAGAAFILAMIPYTLAFHKHSFLNVIVIMYVSLPIISYVCGWILFDEVFTLAKIGLAALAVVFTILFVLEGNKHERISKPWSLLFLSISSSALWVAWSVGFRLVIPQYSYLDAMTLQYLGMFVVTLFLLFLPGYWGDLIHIIKRGKLLGVQVFNEGLGIAATFAHNAALMLAPLASVSLVEDTTQPLIGFALGLLVAIFYPRLHTEHLDRKSVLHKWAYLLLTVSSLYFFLTL